MNEQKHTPEPWRLGKSSPSMCVVVADEKVEGIEGANEWVYYGGNMVAESVSPANARRIVACVNACRGIDTEKLEVPGTPLIELIKAQSGWYDELGDTRDKLDETEHQRDTALRERDEARAMVAELTAMADDLLEDCFAEHGPTPGTECATCDRYEGYRKRLEALRA